MLDDLKNELLPENPSEGSRCNERNVKMNEKATNEFGGNRCEKGVETMSEIIGDKREPMSKDAGNSNSLRVPNTKGNNFKHISCSWLSSATLKQTKLETNFVLI